MVDTDMRDRGLIMALLLQLKIKELFVQSVINPAQGQKDPPEQGLTSKYHDIGASATYAQIVSGHGERRASLVFTQSRLL
jgi:hypothetical protein